MNDKIILALDFPDAKAAAVMVEKVSSEINFFKIGLELLMSGSYFDLVDFLKENNKKIFADLKFYDIPQTVGAAVRGLSNYDVDMLTIHTANQEIMRAAVENKGSAKILGVTVLTSLEADDLNEMGFDPHLSLIDLVLKKTELALKSGLDGIVASALEAKILRQEFGDDFLIVTPGIRLEAVDDDQKRVADVKTAITNGASHLVVGRPITRSENPLLMAQKFNQLM